ncbi:MAG: hypothetical protein M3Y72_15200 [Acidobacteriota bacterium]|nr:hypothetical protein [Acidobacteriota bacterium]
MPSSETDPKPKDKPAEKDVQGTKEEDKNVDRDGRERQPNQHTDKK